MPTDEQPQYEYRPWGGRRRGLFGAFDQRSGQIVLAVTFVVIGCLVAVALIVGSQVFLGNYDLRVPFAL
jgi:hypothetical protein